MKHITNNRIIWFQLAEKITNSHHNGSSNVYINWKNSPRLPYGSSENSYVPYRPTTRAPYTWRPVTRLPLNWWRRPAMQTVTWYQPSIRDPKLWLQPTTKRTHSGQNPVTPASVTKRPVYTRPPAMKPITSRPANSNPATTASTKLDIAYPQLLITVDYETYKLVDKIGFIFCILNDYTILNIQWYLLF